MIDVQVSSSQSVDISTSGTPKQEIQIFNVPTQTIAISANETQNVDITNANAYQVLEIVTPWVTRAELKKLILDIDSKVPKALSVLPQAESKALNTMEAREACKIYIDAGGAPAFATMEQIKELNTKTIFVDRLTDEKIQTLSNEDIILLRKE